LTPIPTHVGRNGLEIHRANCSGQQSWVAASQRERGRAVEPGHRDLGGNFCGRAVETCVCRNVGRPNGLEVNPRGQGPRAEAVAARRLPAFEARGAGGVTPFKYR
jgi:hypothetical protein